MGIEAIPRVDFGLVFHFWVLTLMCKILGNCALILHNIQINQKHSFALWLKTFKKYKYQFQMYNPNGEVILVKSVQHGAEIYLFVSNLDLHGATNCISA